MTFLHMLAVVLAMALASSFNVFELNQLNAAGLKGGLPRAALYGLQVCGCAGCGGGGGGNGTGVAGGRRAEASVAVG